MNIVRGYELGDRIGAGGFGEVYRAYQPDVEREVAIKVIRPEYVNNPDFIRRFEVEAHIVARLEHIHIIPLYDYWREPTGAYLVMRWLPNNLRKVLRDRIPPVKSTAFWLDQIASGLMAAHRRSVVHRDLKPDNILLDSESNAYLADFGIAKIVAEVDSADSDKSSGYIGSVTYSSPEQLREEKVTPQSDIYSLGIMIFELLTGITPFSGSSFGALVTKHLYESMPPLTTYRIDLNGDVNDVLQKATHKEPARRFADVMAFSLAFNQALAGQSGLPYEIKRGLAPTQITRGSIEDDRTIYLDENSTTIGFKASPFKGLRSFNEADAGDFFGRAELTQRLVARLAEPTNEARLLAVVGPSGSGKTSVVQAGLIPAIRHGALPGSERWFEIELTPGADPLRSLEAALLSVAVNPPANIAEQLATDRFGFLNLVKTILPGTADEEKHLLVVIDQFEEIFTLTEDQDAIRHFLELIHTAVTTPRSPIRVVLTLRADFYDRPLLYPEFGELIRKRTEVVLPLTTADLTDAILKPLSRVAVTLEPQLIAEIIRDVSEQPGALPLMQYALTELYAQRKGQVLTVDVYHQMGGVLGALAQRADDLFESLDEKSQVVAEQLFLRLITLGDSTNDTHRRVHQSEILSIADNTKIIKAVIDLYGKYWLLTFDSDPVTRVPTVEIAHEALIQRWSRLQSWITNSRDGIRLQRSLASAAEEWIQNERDLDYLAAGARLSQFKTFSEEGHIALNEDERLYVAASVAAQQARQVEIEKRRENQIALGQRAASLAIKADTAQTVATKRLAYLVGVLLVSLIVVGVLLIITLQSDQKAQDSAQQSESLRLAASAVNEALAGNGVPATLLALRSINKWPAGQGPDIQGDAALQIALAHNYSEQIFSTDQATIQDARFSPDNRTVVAALTSKNNPSLALLKIWDAATGAALTSFTVKSAGVSRIDYAHDGKRLAVVNTDGSAISLWDLTGSVPTAQQQWKTASVKTAVFAPNDRTLLTASDSQPATLWDVSTGTLIRQFGDQTTFAESAAFSADGKEVLTANSDGSARLYAADSGILVHTFVSPTAGEDLHSAALSPDGKFVAAGGYNELIYVWDAQTGALVDTLEGHADEIKCLAFSVDGNYLISGSADLSAIVWKVATGTIQRHYVGHSGIVTDASFSPDGGSVLTVSNDPDDGTARLWLAGSSSVPDDPLPRQLIGHSGAITDAVYSPDGKLIATASKDGTARVWDAHTGKQLLVYTGHSLRIWWIAFSPDSKWIVTVSDDATAQVWDARSGTVIRTFKSAGTIWAAAFSPDGTQLITGGADHIGHLWDLKTGKEVLQLTGHTDNIYGAAFSPDGKTIVTVSVDRSVRLWDAHTGQEIREFLGHTNEIYAVVFSHDGKRIATASKDKTAIVWDVATGSAIKEFTGHNDVVWTVQFSADDQQLLTAGQDGTARIWNVSTGSEIRRITGHTGAVTSAVFSPDGQWIATSGYDHTLGLTSTNPHTLVNAACQYAVRDFTVVERAEYGITDSVPTCPK